MLEYWQILVLQQEKLYSWMKSGDGRECREMSGECQENAGIGGKCRGSAWGGPYGQAQIKTH